MTSTHLAMPRIRFGIVSILLAVVCGCADSPADCEYRAINQVMTAPSETVSLAEAPADDGLIDNQAMMSIRADEIVEAPVSALQVANPRQVELLVPSKSFLKDRQTSALRLTFDDINLLAVLNMEPVIPEAVAYMPDWLRSLDGERVRIRGFMYPTFETKVERFALLRDNKECCYGPGAKIYDNIDVQMKPGTLANYVSDRESLEVVGRFRIRMQAEQGYIMGLYIIEDATVMTR